MIYATADLHLGHERAILFPKRKGFTVESWAKMMIDIINSTVKKGDRLLILGDFACGPKGVFQKYRNKILVKDILFIKGNHDPSDDVCKQAFGQTKVRETHECKIKDKPCWLSHYPHMAWPKSHYGAFHLHGHLHDQRSEYWDSIWPERRCLDVAPESYLRLKGKFGIWNEDEIYEYMMLRTGHDDVSYYKNQYGNLGD